MCDAVDSDLAASSRLGHGDPFGDGLVVVLGVAAPIAMPLIGWPQQP